ncbi:hypothetical protein MLD38_033866 [Melastoma candidum]|uniref:Uncharacterized protein n=1 Tax=Melastoma candidum TaxID=119954 RepID=A0ACB9M829_9MYRT|nr:hypothetical protein MLD38_033866 [Melastoma candidum]
MAASRGLDTELGMPTTRTGRGRERLLGKPAERRHHWCVVDGVGKRDLERQPGDEGTSDCCKEEDADYRSSSLCVGEKATVGDDLDEAGRSRPSCWLHVKKSKVDELIKIETRAKERIYPKSTALDWEANRSHPGEQIETAATSMYEEGGLADCTSHLLLHGIKACKGVSYTRKMADHNFTPVAGSAGSVTHGSASSGHGGSVFPHMQIPASIFTSLVKLDDTNYLVWKGQLMAAIVAAGFEDFISSSSVPPSQFLDLDGLFLNLDFKMWQRTDKAVMSLLFSALTSETLGQVFYCKTASEVWITLKNRFESVSPSRVMNLKVQMQQLRKDGRTMQQHLSTLKNLVEQLAAVGEPISQRDYLWCMLEGLPLEYDVIVTSIYSSDRITVEEAQNLLVNFDIRLERRQGLDCTLPQVHYSSLNSNSGSHIHITFFSCV